jgi:cyclase
MLRKRLITVLTFNDGVLFRTKLFVPDYRYTLNFVDAWSIDEIVVLDVSRKATEFKNRAAFLEVVEHFAKRCFVPLTIGGGIRTTDDVRCALQAGADKVSVNTGAYLSPHLIEGIAGLYGTQCVVLSMDAKRDADGVYRVYHSFGSQPTGMSAEDWARDGVRKGAGEILVNSIERDGSLQGYDLELCRLVSGAVNAPVLICGGAGNWSHFLDGYRIGGADAVCTTNIYHFTETSIKSAKDYLSKAGVATRI